MQSGEEDGLVPDPASEELSAGLFDCIDIGG